MPDGVRMRFEECVLKASNEQLPNSWYSINLLRQQQLIKFPMESVFYYLSTIQNPYVQDMILEEFFIYIKEEERQKESFEHNLLLFQDGVKLLKNLMKGG